jgi:sensor histidine kinase regulating citrate/malate metabolism
VSLRTRLLAAFAYVLVLVIVALEVPLVLNVSRRVDAEVKAQAAAEAQLVAASAAGQRDDRAALSRIAADAGRELGGRVIVVDSAGRLLADSAGLTTGSYRNRPEIQTALVRGRIAQGRRFSETLGESLLYTSVPIVQGDRRVGAVRVTQSVDAIDQRVRRDVLGLIGIGLVALALGLGFGGCSPAPSRARCSGLPTPPGAWRRATSKLARSPRARRSTGRWLTRSTT